MRMDMTADALPAPPGADAQLHGPNRQGAPAPSHEQGIHPELDPLGPLFQPSLHGVDRKAADGHDARLVALAEHPYGAIREVDVGQAQADELRQPKSRGVEQ